MTKRQKITLIGWLIVLAMCIGMVAWFIYECSLSVS